MIACGPTASAVVEKVATLPEVVPVPRTVAPSLKVTVPPFGTPGETVAVKVTDWPKTVGLTDEVTVAVVSALFTVCALSPELSL